MNVIFIILIFFLKLTNTLKKKNTPVIDYFMCLKRWGTLWERERNPTINLVSPLDSVSVMKLTDSRCSTTALRSFGYRERESYQDLFVRQQLLKWHWSVSLPVSQIERWSLGESAVYQYHHWTPLLKNKNTFHSTLTYWNHKNLKTKWCSSVWELKLIHRTNIFDLYLTTVIWFVVIFTILIISECE